MGAGLSKRFLLFNHTISFLFFFLFFFLIYTAQGSPFRCKKLSVINGSPERNNVLKLCIHMDIWIFEKVAPENLGILTGTTLRFQSASKSHERERKKPRSKCSYWRINLKVKRVPNRKLVYMCLPASWYHIIISQNSLYFLPWNQYIHMPLHTVLSPYHRHDVIDTGF